MKLNIEKKFILMKILFLILFVMSSVAFSQTTGNDEDGCNIKTPEAYKFFEFEKINKTLLEEKVKAFQNEVEKESGSTGYTISYGVVEKIAEREKQIMDLIDWRGIDPPRFLFIRDNNSGNLKTVFWIIPLGAEPPLP